MKNILLPAVIFASLLISCTDELTEDTKTYSGNIESRSNNTAKTAETIDPANPANSYDIAGKIHNDLLDAYPADSFGSGTISQVSHKIDSISALNNDLLGMATNLPVSFSEIQQIVDDPQLKLEQAIADSGMTSAAKTSLSGFMASLLLWEAGEYGEIHQSIVSFEALVISETQFTAEDKRIILTTSSIARYSIYYAKERKDKDWETSVGNRVGALQGAVNNSCTAVKKSVLAGIIIRNLQ